MLDIGEYNTLIVERLIVHGAILRDDELGQEVLLPGSLMPAGLKEQDEIEVFIYRDSEDRLVATTETPHVLVNQFAYLEVKDVNDFGAFMEWGLSKDLFVPFKQQPHLYRVGDRELVYVLLDDTTDRLVAVGKNRVFFNKDLSKFEVGQEVEVLVYGRDDMGYRVLVDKEFNGKIFDSDCMVAPERGAIIKAFIKSVRRDGKLDLTTYPEREVRQTSSEAEILERLKIADGKLPFNSKTSAEVVMAEFGMSRKIFKKSIGALYKQKIIDFTEEGMVLIKDTDLKN